MAKKSKKDQERERQVGIMNKYQLSALATSLEDGDLVRAALEEQVYSFGWDEDEAEGVIEGALASGDGIKKALQVYASKYRDALYGVTVGDLFTEYDPVLQDFLGEGSDEYKRALKVAKAHKDDVYGDVAKAIGKAKVQIENAKTLELSDREIDSAKNTLERYVKITNILAMLENNKLESLRPKVVKRATKRTLKDILIED